MDKSNLLRRCAEILAGVVISATIVVYTLAGINNAGDEALNLMSNDTESPDISLNDNLLAKEDINKPSCGDEVSLSLYESEEDDTGDQMLSAYGISINDEQPENVTGQPDESDNSVQDQQPVPDTATPVYKFVNANYLNVRKGPGPETEKLTVLPKATRVQCFDSDGEWVKIITDDNIEGYVFAEYLSDTAPPVYKFVAANTVNLRKDPNSDSELLGTLSFGSKVQVFEKDNDYVRVLTGNGVEGYVWNEYLADETVLASRASSSGQYYNSELANKILEYAKQFVGVKYVYGGSSPDGFDCSGFTQYVFKKFNINLPRSATEYGNVGSKVSRENIKPGDILLFDRYDDYRLGHVGIYLGNDKFIHASSSKGKVVIATLSTYGGNILGIRRVIK